MNTIYITYRIVLELIFVSFEFPLQKGPKLRPVLNLQAVNGHSSRPRLL